MRKAIVLCLLLLCNSVSADSAIQRSHYGSGHLDNLPGVENSFQVVPGVFHAPQYLPYWPTAQSLWARVVDVDCELGKPCTGYSYLPEYGRAEYLFYRPKYRTPPTLEPPKVEVTCVAPEPRVVLVETQCKKKNQ